MSDLLNCLRLNFIDIDALMSLGVSLLEEKTLPLAERSFAFRSLAKGRCFVEGRPFYVLSFPFY